MDVVGQITTRCECDVVHGLCTTDLWCMIYVQFSSVQFSSVRVFLQRNQAPVATLKPVRFKFTPETVVGNVIVTLVYNLSHCDRYTCCVPNTWCLGLQIGLTVHSVDLRVPVSRVLMDRSVRKQSSACVLLRHMHASPVWFNSLLLHSVPPNIMALYKFAY